MKGFWCWSLILVCWLGFSWAEDLPPEKNPQWWLSEARFVYQEGDLRGALQILEEAQRRFPGKLTGEFRRLEARIRYELGEPAECVRILEPLSYSYELPPESLLILAKASLELKDYGKALFYARLVEKRARQDNLICEAKVIVARAYLANRIRRKALTKAQEVLSMACDEKLKARALGTLLEAGYPLEKIQPLLAQQPKLTLYTPEYFKYLGDHFLKAGNLKEASQAYFRYLNLSGKVQEGPRIFFRLAEAFFHQDHLREARTYYEVILTVWPHLDEARFAKFRLYHLNYIFRKKLGLPTLKERKVLIPLINELRKNYPREEITEEAHALEIQLYIEDKRPKEAFLTAVDFLKTYPRSRFLAQVYPLLCEADSLYLQELYGDHLYEKMLNLDRKYQTFVNQARCGPHFYWLGKVFDHYHLETYYRYYFLRAYEFGVPRAWQPDLFLSLAELALNQKKLSLTRELLELLGKIYPFYRHNVFYLYLRGRLAFESGNWQEAQQLFETVLQRKDIPEDIRMQTLEAFFELAWAARNIDLAFQILETPGFPGKDSDYAFLVQMALENEDYIRARKILAAGEKKFPESVPLKWLKGLLLERMGQEKQALEVWKLLAGKETTEGKLAQGILRSLELVEEARKVIY